MESLKIKSYAKINLALKIENKRNDGYHNIKSIMQTISICDNIKLTKINQNKITCNLNVSKIPTDENNLAVKAAIHFFKFLKIPHGVKIYINKKIPTKAGLGGGSSNAACVLLGLNKLFKTNLSFNCLIDLAYEIGADVPFFIRGGTALVEGIGEKIRNITPIKNINILIVKPNWETSTKIAYLKYDKQPKTKNNKTEDYIKKLYYSITTNQSIKKYYKYLFNDFETINKTKKFYKIKTNLLKLRAKKTLLCGSGSSIFGLFKKYKHARIAQEYFTKKNIEAIICHPIKKYIYFNE